LRSRGFGGIGERERQWSRFYGRQAILDGGCDIIRTSDDIASRFNEVAERPLFFDDPVLKSFVFLWALRE
jgi:hypothetical protein